ncbi:hypothetical protein BC940DRAFT_298315 [Gongronella butleri]|nr:hypothetical protein BC940DRAFT_298315 [Gongronella butleri]
MSTTSTASSASAQEQEQDMPADCHPALPHLYPPQPDDSHPIPSVCPVPFHAPPEDTSELLSPWWSEQAEVTDQTVPDDSPASQSAAALAESTFHASPSFNSSSDASSLANGSANGVDHAIDDANHHKVQQQDKLDALPKDESGMKYFLSSFGRTAEETASGQLVWKEDCVLWTKEPKHLQESNLTKHIEQLQKGSVDHQQTMDYPTNDNCHMVCLFRRFAGHQLQPSQQELEKQQPSSPFSWNPMANSWLVVTNTRQAFFDHLAQKDIEEKHSNDYYTIDLGDRFSHAGEDMFNLVKRTFSPIQELTRRYTDSWKDGSQAQFFTRFYDSARRGDAFSLLRDSARRVFDNMVDDDKKKEDD